jgi:predicted DsbA family dithiol-disulfide isomerase
MEKFQLDASFVASDDDNMVEHLAEKYRKDKTQEMMDSMTQNAKNSGLDFHFEKQLWPIHSMHTDSCIWLKIQQVKRTRRIIV